jgi:uncharacterized membrane protein
VSDRRLRQAVVGVALVGAAVAGYLTWVHYQPEALLCTTGGCETVQNSSYATIAGLPVALLGVLAYVAVIVLTAVDTAIARALGAAICLGGAAFAIYLVALQAFVIDAWCGWCLVNDLAIVPALAALSVLRLRSAP